LKHISLAKLLLEESDYAEALEHPAVGTAELWDTKMRPALEGGLTLLEQVEH
jgi:hypothetical protein